MSNMFWNNYSEIFEENFEWDTIQNTNTKNDIDTKTETDNLIFFLNWAQSQKHIFKNPIIKETFFFKCRG